MKAEIYWTNENLATMPHPRGDDWLEDEIISLKNSGVDVLVSMLEGHEVFRLRLEKEEFFCRENDIVFLNFPVVDRNIPNSFDEVFQFVRKLFNYSREEKKIAIHCFAGIGRSSLIACCLLVLQGMNVDDAFLKISQARGFSVPDTREQIEWAYAFAEKFGNAA
ncbi:MAG: dual specificity protein phosphatase family protein [Pyrinomonadaceae bacterium]